MADSVVASGEADADGPAVRPYLGISGLQDLDEIETMIEYFESDESCKS